MKTWSRSRVLPMILQYRFFVNVLSSAIESMYVHGWTDGRTYSNLKQKRLSINCSSPHVPSLNTLTQLLGSGLDRSCVSCNFPFFCGCLRALQGQYPPSSFLSNLSKWYWMMNYRGHGRKLFWPDSGCCDAGFWEGLRNTTKASGYAV